MSSWVRSGALAGAPELIAELGGDAAALASAAGIDEAAFRDKDFPVPARAAVAFIETAAATCGCESFGLRLAQVQDMTLLGPLAPLMHSATTVREMLQDLARFLFLHTTGLSASLESSPQGMLWNYSLAAGVGVADRHTMELGIALLVRELRKCKPGWMPKRVLFRHSAPKNTGLHRQVFGRHVVFNADRNALLIDTAMLSAPFGTGDADVHRTLASHFSQQRKHLPQLMSAETEAVIRLMLPYATCDIALIAQILRSSKRTLQRRLAEEGTRFNDVLDAVRADLAQHYLRQSELSIGDIAEVIGFSETSALTRACRRWYGHPPRGVRHGGGQAA